MAQSEPSEIIELPHAYQVINGVLEPQLASFRTAQSHYLTACERYAANTMGDTYWEIEHSELLMQDSIIRAMHAVAVSQKYPRDKLNMVYALQVADDAVRAATYRELVPSVTFQTLRDYGDTTYVDSQMRQTILATGFENMLNHVMTSTVNNIHADTLYFAEACT